MIHHLEQPTPAQVAALSGDWCVSYSGGKDSSAAVSWIEFLSAAGLITPQRKQLVQSNTTVEEQHLQKISTDFMEAMSGRGWECAVVEPRVSEKLYNRILGIGNTPVHPGGTTRMRWCTRATKIDPMDRWRKENSNGLVVTGLRLGESTVRDAKLAKRGIGCAAGGECGIPAVSDNTYSPLISWTMCNVIDWLSGAMSKHARELMADILPITKRLVAIYNVSIGQDGLWEGVEKEVSAARFGCIGCPAISADRCAPKSTIKRNGPTSPLNEIYNVWYECRRRRNRLVNRKTGGYGPIRMAFRKVAYAWIVDIQQRAGITLVSEEDKEFIHRCWDEKRYPRGWSEADELNAAIEDHPLLDDLES